MFARLYVFVLSIIFSIEIMSFGKKTAGHLTEHIFILHVVFVSVHLPEL